MNLCDCVRYIVLSACGIDAMVVSPSSHNLHAIEVETLGIEFVDGAE